MSSRTHTQGPVRWQSEDGTVPYFSLRDGNGEKIASFLSKQQGARKGAYPRDYEDMKARAQLATEAFNVAHETGLTPRQLAMRQDKMIRVLKNGLAAERTKLAQCEAQRADLLAALKRMTHATAPLVGDDSNPDLEAAWDTARAAISKATGAA